MNAIDEIAVNMPISMACSLIGIPRRTYYARKPLHMRSVSSRISSLIVHRIKDLCHERVTYGYRRIWALLRNEGINLNQKTVLKIMKNENVSLEAHMHRDRKGWSKLYHPDAPDELWETDLTYVVFLSSKSFLGAEPPRVHGLETLRGILFVNIVSLAIRSAILTQMKKTDLANRYSMEKILLELHKIRKLTLQNGKEIMTEITKKERDIIEKFSIKLEHVPTFLTS